MKQQKKVGYKECEWDEVIDINKMFVECSRILRPNGKCILFGQEPYTSSIITEQIPSLPFSYRAIWYKKHAGNKFVCNKAMVNQYEDICIFSKKHSKYDYDLNHPLREYFNNVLIYLSELNNNTTTQCKKMIIKTIGGRAEHTFRVSSTQFKLCTQQTYRDMVEAFNLRDMPGFKKYDELNEIHNKWNIKNLIKQSDLYPSVFNLWEGGNKKSNVLEYKKDVGGFHPTQKPVLLLEDLIKTFSNENDFVLDFTMGSGSTGVACMNTGRKFIGIEKDEGYFNISVKRIGEALTLNKEIEEGVII